MSRRLVNPMLQLLRGLAGVLALGGALFANHARTQPADRTGDPGPPAQGAAPERQGAPSVEGAAGQETKLGEHQFTIAQFRPEFIDAPYLAFDYDRVSGAEGARIARMFFIEIQMQTQRKRSLD